MSVGLDLNRTRTGLVSWTRGDQNRLLVSGLTSVVEPITTAYIRWGAAPRRERDIPCVGNPSCHHSVQPPHRT